MTAEENQNRIKNARIDVLRQELLAPVLSIAGYTDLLKEHLDTSGELEESDDLAHIEKACLETRKLVNAMLEGEVNYPTKETRDQQRSIFLHDLRNSIGVIAGYSEMLLEDLEDAHPDDGDGNSYLSHMVSESRNLLEQLDNVFSKTESKPADLEKSLAEDLSGVFESFERDRQDASQKLTGHILIVDDNESSLNLLSHQLLKQGHRTSTATSGKEALETMAEESPDLVLLDLLMPDMNGFEVLHTMRDNESLRAIPVIVITGLQDKEGAARCIEVGAFDILVKPINPMLLRARVSACLERKAWHDKEQAYQEELEKSYAFIRKVFGRYLSDDIVKTILDDDDGLQLGGGRQKVTVMMTDIRGFTSLSQELDPEQCVTLLNNYFEVMTPLLLKHGATIDEFLGDAILAIFGAPIYKEDDSERALLCAIEMQRAMNQVNSKNQENGLPTIQMGIGLNTGEVVVGNIGSVERSKYGIVGHHVNLTSRVESFTVGNQILASEFCVEDYGGDILIGETAEVNAKGIKEAITIFEILGLGAPHSIAIDESQEQLLKVEPELEISLAELSGKAIDKDAIPGHLIAAADRRARIKSLKPLQRFTNLRISIIGVDELGDEEIYAKVIAKEDLEEKSTQEAENKASYFTYIVNITSCPKNTRNYIQSICI